MTDFSLLSEDPDDFCFFDVETRALPSLSDPRWGDVTKAGAYRYSRSAKVVILTYAIGHGPIRKWLLEDFDKTLRWHEAPRLLLDFMARALNGAAWFVAWNAAFDRLASNHAVVRPSRNLVMPVDTVIDAMAQAAASNLPTGLGRAHKAVGGDGKVDEGKALIALFCHAEGATPQSHPEQWERFVGYAEQDIVALRDVFFKTRPLFRWEWDEYWVSEQINDRGLPIDRHFVERAAHLAALYQAEVDVRVKEFTHGDLRTVNQHVAMAQWVYDRLEHLPEATSILTKRYAEDEEGALIPDKVSVERRRIEKLLPLLERLDREEGLTDDEHDVLQLLEVREYGASATPKKFAKMLPMLDDRERLCGQYVWNGAQQTGRFSSRGVQMHNLTRKALKNEAEALEAINDIELGD